MSIVSRWVVEIYGHTSWQFAAIYGLTVDVHSQPSEYRRNGYCNGRAQYGEMCSGCDVLKAATITHIVCKPVTYPAPIFPTYTYTRTQATVTIACKLLLKTKRTENYSIIGNTVAAIQPVWLPAANRMISG